MINHTWLGTVDADDKATKFVPKPKFAETSASGGVLVEVTDIRAKEFIGSDGGRDPNKSISKLLAAGGAAAGTTDQGRKEKPFYLWLTNIIDRNRI